jgi:phospholipase/carboxylesterase
MGAAFGPGRMEKEMNENNPAIKDPSRHRKGRLRARPASTAVFDAKTGVHRVPAERHREALIYIPSGYRPENPAPFALMLHGAGGHAGHGIDLLRHLADEAGMIIVAPKSQSPTWDVIAGEYGVDVASIDRLLEYVFDRFAVDEKRLAVGGFSDGASYALSLGLINGGLFSHVIAFSPGFMAPTGQTGEPRFYLSHGTDDRVLPVDRCSRRLVPLLKRAGYRVIYREFEGPHTIPPDISREAVQWLASG